jgi:hypothetical protein
MARLRNTVLFASDDKVRRISVTLRSEQTEFGRVIGNWMDLVF